MMQDRNVIMSALRERICMVPPEQQLVLKEKELGDEFGLSRTPIRQMLQALATEGMVEVRAGFGTVTTELRLDERILHMEVFRQLSLSAAAILESKPVSENMKMELGALNGFASNIQNLSSELFVRLAGRLANAMTSMIHDPILAQSYYAAHWRIVRWRTYDVTQKFTQNWVIFQDNIKRAVDMSSTCTAGDLMQIGASDVDRYKTQERLHDATA